jgi:hypothetical protein
MPWPFPEEDPKPLSPFETIELQKFTELQTRFKELQSSERRLLMEVGELRKINENVAFLILKNDKEGAVKWAKGLQCLAQAGHFAPISVAPIEDPRREALIHIIQEILRAGGYPSLRLLLQQALALLGVEPDRLENPNGPY